MESSERLHIAFVAASLRGGGAERVTVNLAGEMARRGHRVDLVLVTKEGPYLERVHPDVRIVDLESSRAVKALLPLTCYLRREVPDTMLSVISYVSIVAWLANLLSGNRTRHVVREAKVPSRHSPEVNRSLSNIAVSKLRGPVYRRVDGIVSISYDAAEYLAETAGLAKSSITMIHNPAYTPEIAEEADAEVEHPWFRDCSEAVIIGVGRLVPCKKFDVLIEAVSIVAERRPVRLIILGKGRERERLRARAEELGISGRVDLPGFVDNPFAYLDRSDVFVMSSTHEAFGNVVVEALATGTPVVSTDCPGGPPEILEDGKWGRLVPVGDADAMAEAIEATLDEEPRPEELKRRARDFSVEDVAEEYLSVLWPDYVENQ